MKTPNDTLPQSRSLSLEEEHIASEQAGKVVRRPGIRDESNTVHCKAKLLIYASHQ
jgi:hypothetical protein